MKNELLKLIKIISSTNRLDPNTIKRLEELDEEIKGKDQTKLIVAIDALEEIAKKATFTEIRRMSSEALEKIK